MEQQWNDTDRKKTEEIEEKPVPVPSYVLKTYVNS
jgi:hypothetical protein